MYSDSWTMGTLTPWSVVKSKSFSCALGTGMDSVCNPTVEGEFARLLLLMRLGTQCNAVTLRRPRVTLLASL